MAVIQAIEEWTVTLQVDVVYPDTRRIEPRAVTFDNWPEAADAIGRGLRLFAPGIVTAMVSRELTEPGDDGGPSVSVEVDLADWPSGRHVVTGARGAN